jgi:D-lyxose ketol-isomerase
MQNMTPSRLHEFWQTIESTPVSEISSRNDVDLVDWLLDRFELERELAATELNLLKLYISSRLPLIRDLTIN